MTSSAQSFLPNTVLRVHWCVCACVIMGRCEVRLVASTEVPDIPVLIALVMVLPIRINFKRRSRKKNRAKKVKERGNTCISCTKAALHPADKKKKTFYITAVFESIVLLCAVSLFTKTHKHFPQML